MYERYERLIGYEHTHIKPSILSRIAGAVIPGYKAKHLVNDGIPNTNLNKRSSSSDAQGQAQTRLARPKQQQHKYFFAINLYNSFDVIPDLFSTMFKVSSIVGFHNVFVSVYENGSTDQTKALLRLFDALSRSVGLRVVIRTSLRTRGQFNHRIEYLAEVRNAALAPLQELRDAEGEVFDSVIFMVSLAMSGTKSAISGKADSWIYLRTTSCPAWMTCSSSSGRADCKMLVLHAVPTISSTTKS